MNQRFISLLIALSMLAHNIATGQDEKKDALWEIDNQESLPSRSVEDELKGTRMPSTSGFEDEVNDWEDDLPQPKEHSNTFFPLQKNQSPQQNGKVAAKKADTTEPKTAFISFNNVNIIEFLNYISRISNKNFVFDANDLQFNITIIMEEPATIDDIMTALLQVLRVHGLALIEEGNNLVIHTNPNIKGLSSVVGNGIATPDEADTELVTRVFRLNTLNTEKAADLVRPLTSEDALVEILENSNHLIVTDLTVNVERVAELLASVDAPNSGLVVGQYVVRNTPLETIIQHAKEIMLTISQNQRLIFVPHTATNSIFVVSTPFLVEKAIAILQHLDQTQGTTRIYNLQDLKFEKEDFILPERKPRWQLGTEGEWLFKPKEESPADHPPEGEWYIDDNNNWFFGPEGEVPPEKERPKKLPNGKWQLDEDGKWKFVLDAGESISAKTLKREIKAEPELPVGHIDRTEFFIRKLQYRRGEDIEKALKNIGASLFRRDRANRELISTINTTQWLETSNSLIFTGSMESIDKVNELIDEIDIPLRQVFIETLIMETTIDDSLTYSVNAGSRFGGGDTAGAQAFLSRASSLAQSLQSVGDIIEAAAQVAATVVDPATTTALVNLVDTAATAGLSVLPSPIAGYNLEIVGRDISVGNQTFRSVGALVRALRLKDEVDIIINPKIITEDNVPATIFVGESVPFQTQSITNALTNEPIASNSEFRDIGVTLTVTPFLGPGDIITLEIEQESSQTGSPTNVNDPFSSLRTSPTTFESRTKTRVHLPDGYFLVLSGLLQDEKDSDVRQTPCLGGIPFLGALFKDQLKRDQKRNQMIFIRPQIIDTEEEMQELTRRQQDIWKFKKRNPRSWKFEMDEALDFLNLTGKEPCECEDSAESEYY